MTAIFPSWEASTSVPVATIAGTPSARARIAVCEVGVPSFVTKPKIFVVSI